MPLLLMLFLVPVVEIAAFVAMTDTIGLLPAVALLFLMGIVGAALLKREGQFTLQQARVTLRHNQMPIGPAFDGLCIMIAAIFLMVPGFVSDVIGLSLLLPPVRTFLRRQLTGRTFNTVVVQRPRPVDIRGDIIDVEFKTVDPAEPDGSSRWGKR